MKWLSLALLVVVLATQYRLWLSDNGVREVAQLRDSVVAQRIENERLSERNRQLAEEVRDLKQGFAALEERARSDLGMVAANETYFQVVPPAAKSLQAQPAPGAPTAPAAPAAAAESPTRTASR
jgi:cell division protein FtsB